MLTVLDTQSWNRELFTGNSEFVQDYSSGEIFIVSNVRADGTFCVLKSNPVPPDPGPGASFSLVATYLFPQPNSDFDPVIAYDTSGGNPLVHIIGTRDNPSNPRIIDLVKFTFDTVAASLTGPVLLISGSNLRGAYDIVTLNNTTTGGGIHHKMVAVSVSDPIMPALFTASISAVAINDNLLTITATNTFNSGQLIVLNGLTNATFLNGAAVNVITSSPTQFTAQYIYSDYASASDSGTAVPLFTGQSLIAFELDGGDSVVANSLQVIANSPERTGNTYSSVSLVSDDQINVELYYQYHPKLLSFQDQVFTIAKLDRTQPVAAITNVSIVSNSLAITAINSFTAGMTVYLNGLTTATFLNGQTVTVTSSNSNEFAAAFTHADYTSTIDTGVATANATLWDSQPTQLTMFQGRFTDDRLTVIGDGSGNRYLCQVFFEQLNHPEGLVGNLIIGYLPFEGTWGFQTVLGSTIGGSLIQATLSISRNIDVNIVYLLQPFDLIPPPIGELAAYPLHVASVDLNTLAITDITGVYNTISFTWLRGTKSLIDNSSIWAVVGEERNISTVSGEVHTIPNISPFAIQVNNASEFWQNLGVQGFTQVLSSPAQGQYTVEPNSGEYIFNAANAGASVPISYTFASSIVPAYMSSFNIPPVAEIVPSTAIVYRNQPLTLSAGTSIDRDQASLEYSWTENDPDIEDVTISPNGSSAVLNVNSNVGGASRTFNVGVAVVDLFPDQSPIHPVQSVTNVQISSNVITVAVSNDYIPSQEIMLYGINLNAPIAPTLLSPVSSGVAATPITNISVVSGTLTVTASNNFVAGQQVTFSGLTTATYLNGQTVTVSFANSTTFLAPIIHANDASHSDTGRADYPPAISAPGYSVKVTYLNSIGESLASPSTVSGAMAAGLLPVIQSPTNSGNAVNYNVYTSFTSGEEQLQNQVPIALGVNWTLPAFGLVNGPSIPSQGTAFLNFINNLVYTPATESSSSFSAAFAHSNFPSTSVSGYAVGQYQFAICSVTVPFNPAPVIVFPSPAWSSGPQVNVARNTIIEITTGAITNPSTQFPVVITGINDPDDSPSFSWTQISGTMVTIISGNSSSTFTFSTNGANVNGEPLVFQLMVNDGVNPSVSATCTVNVAAYNFSDADTLRLTRSVWNEQEAVTNIAIASNILTVTATNQFIPGQLITFTNVGTATFLNNQQVIVITASSSEFTAAFTHANYAAADTGHCFTPARISQRNEAQTWGLMDQSAIYTDLSSIKRTSVIDGTDRYIVISGFSVLIYGGLDPNPSILRKLLTPNNTNIEDAVHTEQDYTLVIDDDQNLFRYSSAPLINTDNPDTTIDLRVLSDLTFNKIVTTYSFADVRVVALSGPKGCLLLQLSSDTLVIQGILEITTESNLLYGADNIQFIRSAQMENLRTGKVLLGTVANKISTTTAVQISDNNLTVFGANTFNIGDTVVFSGFTGATAFLNGLSTTVLTQNTGQFTGSLSYSHLSMTSAQGTVISTDDGQTYETLIDLTQGQIIGTWSASDLRNQYVTTGEILFTPDSTYSGHPTPPVLNSPTVTYTNGQPQIIISWVQERPDLMYGYNVEYALQKTDSTLVPPSTLSIAVTENTLFYQDLGVEDLNGNATITSVSITSNLLSITATNNFSTGNIVALSGLTTATFLNGVNVTVLSSDGVHFTADYTHSNYGPTSDTGLATSQINQSLTALPENTIPGPNEYSVNTGVYSFNATQGNHNVAITYVTIFQVLETVASGAIQQVIVNLSSGTYQFRVKAFGLDGSSNYSNVQVISV